MLEGLKVLGFSANSFTEGDSEFDVVFSSPEGRFIGEVEGKDNKAINIGKLSQLERNLQEDFARDEVTEFAKGVIFGNAERLTNPSERGMSFTDKVFTGAKRAGIGLVRTPDLFEPVQYLTSNSDPNYAKSCREAIFASKGEIVVFPPPPSKPKQKLRKSRKKAAPVAKEVKQK